MAPVVPISHDDVTTEVAAEDLDPLIGVTVDGRFRVVSSVGKGAMGRVYRAVQVPLNRAVALKVLDTNYGPGRDEAFRRRFLVEAALTARLSHPNTVRVLDYGYSREGLLFLAMEYLDGETLDRVLAKGPLPWRRVLGISQQIARALREAHELGVVHRDLKPSNVMLLNADEDHDFVKVLDFGLVKSFIEGEELEGRAITKQGMLMGSPQYMAPEQGDKNAADPRSDVYSLGVTMFEALTGKVPFGGAQPLEIILKHVHDPVPPVVTPPSLEPAPETMKAIVARCLAKSPMDRFQSMEEVLQALQELAAPSPTKETPVVTEPSVPSRPAPMRTAALIAGFVLAAAGGVGITAALMNRHPPSAQVEGQVVFHVETVPPGATVTYQGVALGTTPLDVQLPPGPDGRTVAEFTLSMPGYLPLTAKAGGSGSRIEMSQTLQRAPEPSPKEARAKAAAEKAEKAAAEKAEKAAAEKAEKAAAEKAAAVKTDDKAAPKVDDEKAAADRAAVEKALADRAAADRAAVEKTAADKADKAAAEKAEKAEKAAKDKSAKPKSARERAAEKAAAEKAAAEKAAAEKAAAEKAAAEKAAAEKAAAEKAAAAEAAEKAAKKKDARKPAATKKGAPAPHATPAPAPAGATTPSASKLDEDDEPAPELKEDLKRPRQ